jgi:hypothetical protein
MVLAREREKCKEKKTKLNLELKLDNGALVSFMSRTLLLELDTQSNFKRRRAQKKEKFKKCSLENIKTKMMK